MTRSHRRNAAFHFRVTSQIVPQTAQHAKVYPIGCTIGDTFAALTLHEGGFTVWIARIPDNHRKNAPLLVNVPYFTAKVKNG